MLKRVDVAVKDAFMDAKNGEFTYGFTVLGLKEGGVDYAMDDNNKPLVSARNACSGRRDKGQNHLRRHRRAQIMSDRAALIKRSHFPARWHHLIVE